MSYKPTPLRFNFGFLLDAPPGTNRYVDLDYPAVWLDDGLRLSPLQGTFQVTRTTQGLYVHGELTSQLPAECSRCLADIQSPLVLGLDDLFYYPPATATAGDNVTGADGVIDLAPLLRELSLLGIPIQPLCRPDCLGLCPECGSNLNEGPCGCQLETLDPRLAALRRLANNDS